MVTPAPALLLISFIKVFRLLLPTVKLLVPMVKVLPAVTTVLRFAPAVVTSVLRSTLVRFFPEILVPGVANFKPVISAKLLVSALPPRLMVAPPESVKVKAPLALAVSVVFPPVAV